MTTFAFSLSYTPDLLASLDHYSHLITTVKAYCYKKGVLYGMAIIRFGKWHKTTTTHYTATRDFKNRVIYTYGFGKWHKQNIYTYGFSKWHKSFK